MKRIIILLALLAPISLMAQEQAGLRTGPFAGVASLGLNPALFSQGDRKWDIHLGSGHFFFENNYGWIRDRSWLEIMLGSLDSTWRFKPAYEAVDETRIKPRDLIVDFDTNQRRRYLAISAGVMGPSFLYSTRSGHSFGLFTQMRALGTTQNLATEFSYYVYDARPSYDAFNVSPFETALFAWAEIGAHYGYRWETGSGTMSMGVNLKRLIGLEGFFFQSKEPFDYFKVTGDTIHASRLDLRYGYTSSNLSVPPFEPQITGGGWAGDIGFTWVSDGFLVDKQFLLGAALTDIGFIRYNQMANFHTVQSEVESIIPNVDYKFVETPSDLDQVVEMFSQNVLSDSTASFSGNAFSIVLPAALQLQGAYRFSQSLSVWGTMTVGIPFPGTTAPRGHTFALVGRFDRRWYGVGLPVSLYNAEKLHVGLVARLGPLTLGTDHIANWIIPADRLSGADFYLALQVPFFGLGNDVHYGKGKRARGPAPKCYRFRD